MQPTFSDIYTIPYIIFFIVLFVLFLWENKLQSKAGNTDSIRYCCIFIFVIFFGFRGYIDTDFMVYYPLYESAPVISDARGVSDFFSTTAEDFIIKIEPGFKFLVVILKSISSEYYLLQIVSTVIDVIFLDYFFKKYSPNYVLGYIVFCMFSGLLIEINLLRNSKAIFIFMYSLQFLKDRNALKYFVCNAIGLLFHSSAIFFFPLYFFLHKKLQPSLVWSLFILGNVIYLGQIKFITPLLVAVGNFFGGVYALMAEFYSTEKTYSSGYGITIGYLEKILIFIVFYTYYNRIVEKRGEEKNAETNMFFNLLIMYTGSYLFLSEFTVLIDRITTLFAVSYWILFPLLYCTLEHTMKMFFSAIIFLFGFYKMYRSNNIIIRKYENILWDNPSVSRAYYNVNKHLDKILNPSK